MGRRFSLLRGGGDIAIDLGTANTLIYVRGEGIVASEPSVVAIDSVVGDVVAVGDEAKRMIGRTPANISAIRPLRHGVIVDFDVTEQMLRYFIGKVRRARYRHPRLVLCVPSGLTGIEVSAVEEASLAAGAGEVHLIEEPIAAAIGAGLDIGQPTGRMVVDVGGGTTEVAVISMGGMVVQRSLPVGGYEFDDAIVNLLRREHGLSIGQPTAEALKLEIGSAGPLDEELVSEVRGREASTGLPRGIAMTSQALRPALAAPVAAILAAVRDVLEETPPELASDIAKNGILLAGGGSLLLGLIDRIYEETQMPTSRAESPLTCVVLGAGMSLEELDTLSRTSRASRRYGLTSSYRRPGPPTRPQLRREAPNR